VKAMVQDVLHRPADPALVAAANAVLEPPIPAAQASAAGGGYGVSIAGAPPSAAASARLATVLFASDEYWQGAGSALYGDLLNRPLSGDSLSAVGRALAKGGSRDELVAAILASDEMKWRLDS